MSTRQQFLNDSQVADFIAWLGKIAPILQINLNIPWSPKVPRAAVANVAGFEALVPLYQWKARWKIGAEIRESNDWASTRVSLDRLGSKLRTAYELRNDEQTLEVCKAILRWGGDRNANAGALPFLTALPNIASYIDECAATFLLANADLDNCGRVARMNSMLTKVHALAAKDGLPIYDSRVAVAVAALVEVYRQVVAPHWHELPSHLTFPSLDPVRDVTSCFRGAISHGTLASRAVSTTLSWVQAKIRLGWILGEVLEQNPNLLVDPATGGTIMRERMHAFEAALFMIGYNPRCLAENFPKAQRAAIEIRPNEIAQVVVQEPPLPGPEPEWKRINTLAKGNPFKYCLAESDGAVIIESGAAQRIRLYQSFIDYIVDQMWNTGWIDGGFSRGPNGKDREADSSFGYFIERNLLQI